ncbi:hypothetical protein BDR04DRAFT_1121801 [Suillus decipiens]|nr:hypothetical protein BDR04DRAFT_1121801 [Suillus decipiens]
MKKLLKLVAIMGASLVLVLSQNLDRLGATVGVWVITHSTVEAKRWKFEFTGFFAQEPSSMIISMPERYHIRMLFSWLRISVRTAVFHSYSSLLAFLLQLIQHYQAFVSGKERTFQELGLAFNSHLTNQEEKTHGTLAVPLLNLKIPPQSEGLNPLASNNQSHSSPSVPSTLASYITMTESSIHAAQAVAVTMPPNLAVPGQFFDTTLTPIIPEQIMRYERNQFQDQNEGCEVQEGPLDCSEELALVSGWEPLMHPEGALFFYHLSDQVFTDVDVWDPGTAVTVGTMGEVVKQLYEKARKADTFHSSVELALEHMEVDGEEK